MWFSVDGIFMRTTFSRQPAMHAVLDQHLLNSLRPELEAIKPMKAVFDRDYVRNLDGKFIKQSATKWDAAQELIKDIENFKKRK